MRRTFLLSSFLSALCVSSALAQVEVGEDGNVGVRNSSTNSSGIYVTCWEDCFRQGSFTYGYGVYAQSRGKSRNRGVYGRALTGPNNSNVIVRNYAFHGVAQGAGSQNMGLYARAEGASDIGYGVFATAFGADENYAGYFSGDVHVTGTLTEASDAMFKRDVEPLGGEEGGGGNAPTMQRATSAAALPGGSARRSSPGEGPPPRSQARTKLLELRPVKYHFRRGAYEEMGFPEGEHFGFLAQEVEAVLPELVTESVHPGREEMGEDGEPARTGEPLRYKSVNYLGLVPMLVQTVKEQQVEVNAYRTEIDTYRAEVETLGQEMEALRDRLERLEGND